MPQNPREGIGGGESEEAGTSSQGLKGSEHLELSSVFKARRFQGGAESNHPPAHHPNGRHPNAQAADAQWLPAPRVPRTGIRAPS